jgi:hypothetical protein
MHRRGSVPGNDPIVHRLMIIFWREDWKEALTLRYEKAVSTFSSLYKAVFSITNAIEGRVKQTAKVKISCLREKDIVE